MKKLLGISVIFMLSLLFIVSAWSRGTRGPIQSNIKHGQYIPKIPVKISDLRNLPVPTTNENYALLQAIDKETNVVLGNFNSGSRELILIKDKNSDGKVDAVVHYYVDRKRYRYSSKPGADYPPEKFKKLKEAVLNGTQGEFFPNKEGIPYIKVLEQDADRIRRWKNGFRVFMLDPDDERFSRISFFFSTSNRGADLVFEVKYRNQGVAKISPIINFGVYCNGSKDKYINSVTRKLVAEAKKFVPVGD